MAVEQLAVNKTGSVLAKGAFDKNDALYMRDEAEKARHEELEQRDAELAQFARVRSAMEQDAAVQPYSHEPALKKVKFARPKVIPRATLSNQTTTPASEIIQEGNPPGNCQGKVQHSELPGSLVGKIANMHNVAPSHACHSSGLQVGASTAPARHLGLQYESGESSSEEGGEGV